MATKKTKPIVKKTTIYIGTSLKGLPQYTMFKYGELPTYIKQMTEQNEAILGLIVPLDNLQEARINVKKKGHVLNHYLNQLKNKEN